MAIKPQWDLKSCLRGIWLPQTRGRRTASSARRNTAEQVTILTLVDIAVSARVMTPSVIFDAFLRFLLFCPSTTHFPHHPLTQLPPSRAHPSLVFSPPVLLHR